MKATRTPKAVSSLDQWGSGLAAFRERHQIGWRQFERLLGGAISRKTLSRLCNKGTQPKFQALRRPLIVDRLRDYLESKEFAPDQIEKELRAIFCAEEVTPLITQRAELSKPAQGFFGLRVDPFTGDPRDRSGIFTTPKLDRIAAMVEDAVNYQGFVAVIGDVGSGKSLLKKRVVQTCLDSNGKKVILWPQFFNMEMVDSASICTLVLREFEQRPAHNRVQRAEQLRKFLGSLSDDGVRVALGFDECHRLHPNLLTSLKNFWELGSGGFDRYLGLVLFGQPRFENTLRIPEFREIAERLSLIRMPDLSKQDDAWKYVTHRVKCAGGSADKLFDRGAIDSLAAISATPQAIGNLCNASLMKAHEFNQRKVTKEILKAVFGSENGEPDVRGVRRR